MAQDMCKICRRCLLKWLHFALRTLSPQDLGAVPLHAAVVQQGAAHGARAGAKDPGREPPSRFHPLIACPSSSQSLLVCLSELVVVRSLLLQHCRASGHCVGDGGNGGDGWHPRGCCQSTHPEFSSSRGVDVEQMWLCWGGARIPVLCQRIPGEGRSSASQNRGCTKLPWGISKHTHKHFALPQCWHWSMREAAVLSHVPTMRTPPLLFSPSNLAAWSRTQNVMQETKPTWKFSRGNLFSIPVKAIQIFCQWQKWRFFFFVAQKATDFVELSEHFTYLLHFSHFCSEVPILLRRGRPC